MRRDYKVYLEDIQAALDKIRRFTADQSLQQFSQDDMRVDAVIRNLEIIGEATKKLPHEVRARQSQVEWKKVAGLRDILIHEYFGIDLEIIWDIIKKVVDRAPDGTIYGIEKLKF